MFLVWLKIYSGPNDLKGEDAFDGIRDCTDELAKYFPTGPAGKLVGYDPSQGASL
jgi:hypothetical protein